MQTKKEGILRLKALTIFASKFGAQIAFNPEFIVERAQRYYLLNPQLRKVVRSEFFYAGLYLGKVKKGIFFPSFNFLNALVDISSNKVFLDKKSAWLFICGRDIFRHGLQKTQGPMRQGDFTLVMNEHGECLGFGSVASGVDEKSKIAIRNVLDIGDFLRRER